MAAPATTPWSAVEAGCAALIGLLILVPVFGQAGDGVEVEIVPELVVPAPAGTPILGTLSLEPASNAAEAAISRPLDGVSPLRLRLPAESVWRLSAQVPGFWARPVVLGVARPPAETRSTFDLWPTSEVYGRVRLAEGGRAPARILLRVQPPWGSDLRDRFGEALIPCPIEAGSFRCAVPATRLDLGFRARGFISHYRWAVEIRPGTPVDVGTLVLKPGSSVAGRVEAADPGFDPARVKVLLEPLAGPAHGQAAGRAQLAATATEAGLDVQGFFHFEGVAPGAYTLRAEHPGFAPAQLHPLLVAPGAESALREPLVLERPIELEIQLTPPMDPRGRAWRLLVVRGSDWSAGADGRPVHDGDAPASGLVRLPGQRPGLFAVHVADQAGNRWASEDGWRAHAGGPARLELAISSLPLEGELLLGEEPLPEARVWLGGKAGNPRVELVTDARGRFSSLVPKAGKWRADVTARALPADVRTEVEIDEGGDQFLRIRLPDTEVYGRVVDGDGKPVARAMVSCRSTHGGARVESQADGSFELRGLNAGVLVLSASSRSEQGPAGSQGLFAVVAEGRPAGPFELVLTGTERLAGQVLGPWGAVAGAGVHVSARSGRGRVSEEMARTDLEGNFSVPRVRDPVEVSAVVTAPGFALQAFSVSPRETFAVFEVALDPGTISVRLPATNDLGARRLHVFQDEHVLPPQLLFDWVRGHGLPWPQDSEWLELPQMAAGPYRLCLDLPERLTVAAQETGDWRLGLETCETGFLAPGGALSFDFAS